MAFFSNVWLYIMFASLIPTASVVRAQSFWSSYGAPNPAPQQQSPYSPYMASGGTENYSPASLFSPYNFYSDSSGASQAAMVAPRTGTSQSFMYGGGGGSNALASAAAGYPFMQMQAANSWPMMDALKMPGTTCYCELRENKLGVPGELFDTLVYPALQNTDCLSAGPECNTACEAQARKQYDIPPVTGEEGVLNKQNKDGVSLGSRICAAYNKPIPTPGVKIAVFAKAETCPKAQVVVELLGGEELKFCCLYGDHPFILTEKILLYSPECMGLTTPSGLPAEPAPAAGAAAAAGGTPSAAPAPSQQHGNPFLARYNEHNNPFSPAAMFNPFANMPQINPQPPSPNNPLTAMMAAMFGANGAGGGGVIGQPNIAKLSNGGSGVPGMAMHQNPMSLTQYYPMSAPMTMPPPQSQSQPNSVHMMPYKAAPSLNAPG